MAGFLLLGSQHEGSDFVDFTLVEVLCLLGGGPIWLASVALGVRGLATAGSSRRRAALSLCISGLLVLSWILTFLR
jgi:hypothetical protein